MHVELNVVKTASILPAGTGAFPTTKGLKAWPGPGGRALRAVCVRDTRFNVVKKPIGFGRGTVKGRRLSHI